MTSYWCEHAWLPDGLASSVRVTVEPFRVLDIERDAERRPDDVRLDGLVLPGLANVHSHAFHRALRGRTHDDRGTFWTWRERMYAVASRLDPDSYLRLARAVYAEMSLAGVTAVGEFHYLHHGPDGVPYDDPNAMGLALVQAASDAGVRLTLLDALYLEGGLGPDGYQPLDPVQQRFSDGSVEAWLERTEPLDRLGDTWDHHRRGRAVHSVRAVRPEHLALVAPGGEPLHVHLSEQPAENEACLAVHGCTPTQLLADHDLLGPSTTVVHAVHLTDDDVRLLGASGTGVCACPTTEADLADGTGRFPELVAAGSPLSLGSDQHVETDLLREAQRLDQHERLRSGRRATFGARFLLEALGENGFRALGDDGGRIERGNPADLVAVRLDSPRTAGCDPAQALLVATAADVHTVVMDGVEVVRDGQHRLGDVGRLLQEAITPLWA